MPTEPIYPPRIEHQKTINDIIDARIALHMSDGYFVVDNLDVLDNLDGSFTIRQGVGHV